MNNLVFLNLQVEIEALKVKVEELKAERERYLAMNFTLQEALHTRKGGELKFTYVKGYFKAEWLLMVSQKARRSDYIFVKQLLYAIFPNGIGRATVTGKPSSNPRGSKMNGQVVVKEKPAKIDGVKVDYIRGRNTFLIIVFNLLYFYSIHFPFASIYS